MMNLPVFFTSVAARAARLFKTLEQAADFSSCSPAIAAAIAPFPMLLTTFLLPFMAFMGAIAAWDFGRAVGGNEEMSTPHKRLEPPCTLR